MKEDIFFSKNVKSKFASGLLLVFSLSFLFTLAQEPPWVAPKDSDNLKNPLAGNSSVMPDAKALYTANCGPCHGDEGEETGQQLRVSIPNLQIILPLLFKMNRMARFLETFRRQGSHARIQKNIF